jgi:3-dehydroquinate synthase
MKIINCKFSKEQYPVFIGDTVLTDASIWKPYLKNNEIVIITCKQVASLYLTTLQKTLSDYHPEVIVLDNGEQVKTLEQFNHIINTLLVAKHGRKTTLIALGGGSIGDLVGFVASCFLRGVDLIQVPTTLLAQVDSSMGGKNGVNNAYGKNLIGTFYHPKAVFINPNTIATLSHRDFASGLAEVVKYSLIYDSDFYNWLAENIKLINQQHQLIIQEMIYRTIKIKLAIVLEDEYDNNKRAICNFGHSFGHAIERFFDYKKYLHGEAVAIGMAIASKISYQLESLTIAEVNRLLTLLQQLNLPTDLPKEITINKLVELMKTDKKNQYGNFNIVILSNMGEASLWNNVTATTLKNHLNQFL